MTTRGHMTWVKSGELTRSWLPGHFEPRFVTMDNELRAEPGSYVRLGDVADLVSMWPANDALVTWFVRRRGEELALEPAGRDLPQSLLLPEECLVLHPLVFDGKLASAFWASSVAGGRGATMPACYSLVSRTDSDIAWLEQALGTNIVGAQLERASVGGQLPLVRREDLLDVRVPLLSAEEKAGAAQRARNRLLEARNRLDADEAPRQRVLTGATHEERVDQFERLLFDDGFVAPGEGFYVEAAADRSRWILRPLGAHRKPGRTTGDGSLTTEDAAQWRLWFLEQSAASPFCVFNSLAGGPRLPGAFLEAIAAPIRANLDAFGRNSAVRTQPTKASPLRTGPEYEHARFPSFTDFVAAVESGREVEGDLDLDLVAAEVGQLWDELNPGVPLSGEAFAWLRRAYRPVICIAVHRSGKPVGAFLLWGPDQLERPFDVLASLEVQGEQLAAILGQPSEVAEDAARRESIRRLSWMMHQLNGPMMVMRGVIQELVDYVDAHPEVAEALLPDDSRALARARMNSKQLADYRLAHRLAELAEAAEGIRRLQYQIRRYKNAQGALQITTFPIGVLLDEIAAEARGQLDDAIVQVSGALGLFVAADRPLIRAALSEVAANACRECRERKVEEPTVTLSAERLGNRVQIVVNDNGLPVNVTLLDDPFAEDASTYRTQGKGSGLGLAIVKESFARHGGRCLLRPNTTADGERIPGVRFSSDIPAAEPANALLGVTDV